MTLYLKYRPRTFADVVGQDQIVVTLENALTQNQLVHAYLFCGTRGTGKTSVARILSKAILTRGIDDKMLREQIIQTVDDGSLVDLIEIDAASNRRIDDVRELIERIQFSPIVSKAKVYIIDEVHMLTKEAFNALLKTLEEPPEYAYFILATTELHKVPDTIQSRCQRFLFKRVEEEDLIRRLQFIADIEHITIDRDALRLVARSATGSFRDAISLLDQMRSLERVTVADIEERIGVSGLEFVDDVLGIISTHDIAAVPGLVERLEEAHVPLDHIMNELLNRIRTNMHTSIEQGKNPSAYLPMISLILRTLQDMRISPIPSLSVESLLIALCSPEAILSPAVSDDMTKRAKQTFATTSSKLVSEQARREKQKDAPIKPAEEDVPLRPTIIEAEELTIYTIMKHWETVLRQVTPPHVKMSLKNASVTQAEKDIISLTFPSAFHRDKVADIAASRTIEEILTSIFKRPIRIKCTLEQHSEPRMEASASADLLAAAEEVFGEL